jgi:anti-anti-sigma regulatory factor
MATATSVEALAPGDHACLTFTDPDERLDIVATFVLDGLIRSTKVICLTESIAPEQLATELSDRGVPVAEAVPRKQLTIHGSEQSWLAHGGLNAANVIDLLNRGLDEAAQEGYAGLRVTADMCWVNRPMAAADQLPVFEVEVGKLFGDGRLTAVCQYDREVFDAVTLAFASSTHQRAVAAAVYHEDPILRVCRQSTPPGIRLAGEIDFSHVDVLMLALNEALQLDRDIQVNLAKLHFIDVACATAIGQAGLSLPPGRTMTVLCGNPVFRTLRLVGVGDAGSVRLVRTDGRH